MKKILFLMLTFGIISCGDDDFGSSCLPQNLQEDVIAFYPFDNGSLADASLNLNDLTNPTTAIPTTDRNGNPNCAYQFDNLQNAPEFLTTTNTSFLDGLDKFSISIWYQPMNAARDGGSFETLLSRGSGLRCPNRNGEWSVGLYDCRKAVFGHDNATWTNSISGDCATEIIALTDKWHHVVAVKDKKDYFIYFNGNLEGSEAGNANCSNLQLAQDIGDLFVGSDYTGKIDDVIIYDRALSQAKVAELFDLEPCCE